MVVLTLTEIEKGRVWVIVDLILMRAVAKVVKVFSAAFFDCLNLLLCVHVAVSAEILLWVSLQFVHLSILRSLGYVILHPLFDDCTLNAVNGKKKAQKLRYDYLGAKNYVLVANIVDRYLWLHLISHYSRTLTRSSR